MRVDPEAWGIQPGYHDITGTWREAPQSTVRAVLEAMGAEGPIPPSGVPVWVVRSTDESVHLGGRWELHHDDGGEERVSGTMPVPPPGYYDLLNESDGRRVRLIVSPGACHLESTMRTWGWAAQLYATRSRRSWGIGDFGDLARFSEWARERGAGMVLVNPLHAPTPVEPIQPSPYYPSSRCFLSPLYIQVEDVAGADAVEGLEAIARTGRALNDRREIDRDEVWRLKQEALELMWAARRGGEGRRGTTAPDDDDRMLQKFATFCALAEWYGADWRDWPEDYRHPDSPDVRRYAAAHADRVGFHSWLQTLAREQLARARDSLAVIQDLAIGVDPAGADAWLWQDVIAGGITVGAPPDDYNRAGQDWGFPPFDPWRLRAAQFEPFVQTVRAALQNSSGLRVDHVMGLFRQFWMPAGSRPAAGLYVRFPWEELLDILALESHRANAYIVGEDLGTVEPYVREELARRDVLSYKLMLFEEAKPVDYPERALAAVTTHDLPTVPGLWSGGDIEGQRRAGMRPNTAGMSVMRNRVRDVAGVADDASVDDVVVRAYAQLASAPSMVVAVTLEDAAGIEERPNYPGTTAETNWSMALPMPLEDIEADQGVAAVAEAVSRGRSR